MKKNKKKIDVQLHKKKNHRQNGKSINNKPLINKSHEKKIATTCSLFFVFLVSMPQKKRKYDHYYWLLTIYALHALFYCKNLDSHHTHRSPLLAYKRDLLLDIPLTS
jgi:hypothetical protein